jgi:hypothetical protein
MAALRRITFVVPTFGTDEVIRSNFLASPCLNASHVHQVLVQKGFPSAAKAYNDAIDRAENDLLVFVHQDVILTDFWLSQLERALSHLETSDPNWGVVGSYGVSRCGVGHGWVCSPGPGLIGKPFDCPEPVQTLDELVLVFRKSSGLRFDEDLPHFHLYGTDICMTASKLDRKCYAIPALCVHNTDHYLVLPDEFYVCCRYVRKKWKNSLPIYTSCISINKTNSTIYARRLLEVYLRYVRHKAFLAPRSKDVDALLRLAASAVPEHIFH